MSLNLCRAGGSLAESAGDSKPIVEKGGR